MDLHQLALRRSLAFHRVIAGRLLSDPEILTSARSRVNEWVSEMPNRPFVRMWAQVLAADPSSIGKFLVDESELATELRQSSPFAGALDARERWRIWRAVKEELESRR
jgi:hypothetical protein